MEEHLVNKNHIFFILKKRLDKDNKSRLFAGGYYENPSIHTL